MTLSQFDQLTRDQIEHIRLSAAKDLEKGMKQSLVARKYGVSRTTASRWARRLKAGGQEALLKHKSTGRPSRLTGQQLAKVEKMQSNPFGWLTGKEAVLKDWPGITWRFEEAMNPDYVVTSDRFPISDWMIARMKP